MSLILLSHDRLIEGFRYKKSTAQSNKSRVSKDSVQDACFNTQKYVVNAYNQQLERVKILIKIRLNSVNKFDLTCINASLILVITVEFVLVI